jgi:hypothetical protein
MKKELIIVPPVAINYFVLAPNFQATVVGQAFLNKTTRTVLFTKPTILLEWKELKRFAEDVTAI